MTTASDTAPADAWGSLTSEPVSNLKPTRTESDVPEGIRRVVEDALASGVPHRIHLGNSVRIAEFSRYARMFARLRSAGEIALRISPQPDGAHVHFTAKPRDGAAPPAPATPTPTKATK